MYLCAPRPLHPKHLQQPSSSSAALVLCGSWMVRAPMISAAAGTSVRLHQAPHHATQISHRGPAWCKQRANHMRCTTTGKWPEAMHLSARGTKAALAYELRGGAEGFACRAWACFSHCDTNTEHAPVVVTEVCIVVAVSVLFLLLLLL